ncbi:cation diffusion facilitator family transporter [Breznakiella homolactica]|uniref:Cation transporter n=1 Tax=Breznakiella homolactica TaxID=2798577 RepID=A0A7T8BAA0_9SPIR|nr:cation diffusion facilitator family transporter [Breznakiella homolactica]QQO09156.1 cation diffusion facilitator family transporter [Breznakiella homolactica]
MAHNHNHARGSDHSRDGDGNIGLAFFLNVSFTIIELVGGFFTNSIAIISDAVHDFGDSLSLALAWYFQRLSRKGRTEKYSYGYKRFSLLGAIINSIVLVVGSLYILSEAIPRFFSPQETSAEGMFFLAVIGIVINGIAVLRTRKGRSINERVVSLHMLEDVLGWAAVLAGSIIMYFTGLTIIDPILSVAIACFVLFNVVKNIRQTLPILLQGTPAEIDQKRIVESLESIAGITNIHDLHIWALDEDFNILTAHVTLTMAVPMETQAELKMKIRNVLEKEGIHHATIEFESPDEVCGFENTV